MSTAPSYRWNSSDFAVGYDQAAEVIHPRYVEIQDVLLKLLPQALDAGGLVVDLGGGSGKLVERILQAKPAAKAVVLDQSEPFLALAERRLRAFGTRARCALVRLQDDWVQELPQAPAAIVSMSAIHHLEPGEKRALYQRCFQALAPGGVLLNGDEVRPPDDTTYLKHLSNWAEHMRREMASGAIPTLFHSALEGWIERNVKQFGEPKKSGDDCHETADAQLAYFREAGFVSADVPWQADLWAVLRARKA